MADTPETPITFPCQSLGLHARFGAGPATNRVRFYCERCQRGNTPDDQCDMDMCDGCQTFTANASPMTCDPDLNGCGYQGVGSDFMHPDGPATGRPVVNNGQERAQ